MTNKQNSKLNMYQTVLNTCDTNTSAFADVAAFVNGVAALKTDVAAIREMEELQRNVSVTGVSQSKQSVEDRLVALTMQVANGTYVFAFSTGNEELQKQSSLNKSLLYRAEGNALLSQAKNVSKNARANVEKLEDYGVTSAMLTELDSVIAEFETVLTKPRDTTVERKVYTDSLPKLFAAADSILYDKLDKLVTLFKSSAPEFYSAYKAARNVIDTASRKKKTDE